MPNTVTKIFTLIIYHEGIQKQFVSELRRTGYRHYIVVRLENEDVIFVPDADRRYYLLGPAGHQRPDDGSVKSEIVRKLEEIFRWV